MENIINELKFGADGLIPAVAQENSTGEVLMVAYMNEEAVRKTLETGMAHYFSRSRKKLWLKGETSGHYQHVKSIGIDCDSDTLLLKIEQEGDACHTGHHSCFFREIEGCKLNVTDYEKCGATENSCKCGEEKNICKSKTDIIKELYATIEDRKVNPKEGSYTNYLFEKGIDKILKKVGEESAEVIIAAKNRSRDEMIYEISDLAYHVFVLMSEGGILPEDIYDELAKRHSK